MPKVFLDPGHGGRDPGALGHGLVEKDLNLAIALAVRRHLVRHGLTVRMSRTTDRTVPLRARTDQANAWGAHAFVSIHCNAHTEPSARGFEVWHSVLPTSPGRILARYLVQWLDRLTPLANRGARSRAGRGGRDYYHVIRETRMPAVIVECGFLTNPDDARYLGSAAGQAQVAEAIARGILQFFGRQWLSPHVARRQSPAPSDRASSAPAPSRSSAGVWYRVVIGSFRDRSYAERLARRAREAGFDPWIDRVHL
ncbi:MULTISPECIES: N-acetylmuramoyl-L-alanine amidase [Thermaerobacter]|uniref:N-acetylmuramoyl-L-alanine amidase n=1 Tax=Thermaerobacter composti TaxID=554949 RepID=A0ABZ0QN06_9FIRM|nr:MULTISPECIES: N-acetylmuramoyl-L-alanine amidase [Thermaerobacter]PZN07655.1 MAG: N-acetylmuramoyl-L-alanine amidase [Bacillota bacterium]QBS36883.1 N-acetylmuramoyl-L-alanine amidase [Thermaerobacter sp. FW80]WPD18866.1 N-acetylmuramoyl-L-alanine amidase [Thermaerobacter composti]